MRARRLLCGNVVDVGARDAESGRAGGVGDMLCAADEAGAGGVDGAKVVCEGGVAEVEDAGGCDAVAEALGFVSSGFVCRWRDLGSGECVRRCGWARRSRTCLRRGRRRRRDLLGSPVRQLVVV